MKNILLLTDFSENAANAGRTAVNLCGKMNANLLIFNSQLKVPLIPYYEVGPWTSDQSSWWGDECADKLNKLANRLQLAVEELDPDSHQPTIYRKYGEGEIGSNVKELIKEAEIKLIVMGSSSGKFLDHFFHGNDTASVIDKASMPVLIIPSAKELKHIAKIVMATDFDDGDINAVRYLADLAKVFDSDLELIHINLYGHKNIGSQSADSFLGQLQNIKHPKISYREITGKNVVERFNRLCKETKPDVFALTHRHRSVLAELFEESTVKEALAEQLIPMMIIPSDMEL